MEDKIMASTVTCSIEHHAIMFALLSKYAIELCGDAGKAAILDGMTIYGNERGARMAENALSHGDPITVMTSQAYGEWQPDYEGQMSFGRLRLEPTLQTYVEKCAWCDAWKKHNLLDYGKFYCVNVDHAVFEGFSPDFICTPLVTSLSFGGDRCEFDWGLPLSDDDAKALDEKRNELGTTCMRDFNFHTAHLLHTVGNTLKTQLGDRGTLSVTNACQEYIDKFGQEYLDVLQGIMA